MDVLRPPLIWIGGRCYRKNPVESKHDENYQEEEFDGPVEEDMYADEVCDAFTQIEETENGYRVKMEVPSVYFKYIIGKKGETRRRIENETRTQIVIPRQGDEGDIVINGRDKKGVGSAKSRIDILVESARQKQPFSHFLSFPVAGDSFKQKFDEFKSDVLKFCDGDRGIDGSIFQNPKKLHITLGTLALMSDSEVDRAAQLMAQCQEDLVEPILRGIPLVGVIRGLEYMNDDPDAVDVLYAKIEPQDDSNRLQLLADRLVDRFTTAGLMQQQYDRVKLHITIMNTLMRKDPSGSSQPRGIRSQPRESFNATNVLKLYGDYNFGTHHIDTVHLSQRYSSGRDGYYDCAARLKLP